jgi:hypothetical protein
MILNQRLRGFSLSGCRAQNARRALREITCTYIIYRNKRYAANILPRVPIHGPDSTPLLPFV